MKDELNFSYSDHVTMISVNEDTVLTHVRHVSRPSGTDSDADHPDADVFTIQTNRGVSKPVPRNDTPALFVSGKVR